MLDVFSAEFRSLTFLRLPDLAALRMTGPGQGSCKLAVIDERQLKGMSGLKELAAQSRADMLALAYSSAPPARDLLAGLTGSATLPRIGLFPLNVQIEVLTSVMRLLLCGEVFYPERLMREFLASQGAAPDTTAAGGPAPPVDEESQQLGRSLTPREWQVLTLLAEGKQNKIVAAELGLSEHTVKLHIHHLIGKLGVSNRTGAAIWYLAQVEAGQADPP
ncbi:response regulator transcription factor [Limimaricola pyoseonensis]|uniref:DNA-binding response regulator, NarL/FixJ family, contains REC and HTH domains n=1 Tax=Limimaricola pyoseonensis TaxID=521013 RepID=A0A1G7AEQ4_9RHOB|nr:response regulator transcription factor [Limimaricola pyoseonensis]SDE12346.1 DNA-binding response regulator, NarL/FixJ family, contains REC and HTH domains [Limimaricola pyoseonensis]